MLSSQLIDWYQIYKRDLPWRETTDPYKIWLSEIMLQQTRVDQGMSYYHKFTQNYPTIIDLANASEQQVLNDWQGLGYYSRARNLHATAKYIALELNGKFPERYDEIIKLKGVGPYTAAAVASFAFREQKALVDGNVYRVLSRIFDVSIPIDSTEGKKAFQALADGLIPKDIPDIHNQAIMEFGSLQCTPANPNCDNCVVKNDCLSFQNQTVLQRPIKEKKTKVRTRYFYYAIFSQNQKVCVQKRIQSDIWQHLYEFPLLETDKTLNEEQLSNHFKQTYQLIPTIVSKEIKHILSHQKIIARFVHFDAIPSELDNFAIEIPALNDVPLPRLIDRYLETIEL